MKNEFDRLRKWAENNRINLKEINEKCMCSRKQIRFRGLEWKDIWLGNTAGKMILEQKLITNTSCI